MSHGQPQLPCVIMDSTGLLGPSLHNNNNNTLSFPQSSTVVYTAGHSVQPMSGVLSALDCIRRISVMSRGLVFNYVKHLEGK